MEDLISFFQSLYPLKHIRRTGWVLRKVENPETVAEHSFRTTFLVWMLGRKAGVRLERALPIAIFHDVAEARFGDKTPYDNLARKGVRAADLMKRWLRVSREEKEQFARGKLKAEEEEFRLLTQHLSPRLRAELLGFWREHEQGASPEGRFVHQVDKLEAMLQAIEYFGDKTGTFVDAWWEQIEEVVDHPFLKQFVEAIHVVVYKKQPHALEQELRFAFFVNGLKRVPRPGWIERKVQDPDSLASHTFMLTAISWVLARDRKESFPLSRLIQIALIHKIFALAVPESSSHGNLLEGVEDEEERKKILNTWVRYSVEEKKRIQGQVSADEEEGFRKVLEKAPGDMRAELASLWNEWKEQRTAPSRFLWDAFTLELLLQATEYWEADHAFPIATVWEWAFERAASPLAHEVLRILGERHRRHTIPHQYASP